jgi:hypothetical protein
MLRQRSRPAASPGDEAPARGSIAARANGADRSMGHEVDVAPADAAGHPTTVFLVELAGAARPVFEAHPGRLIVLDVEDQLPFAIAMQTIDTLRGAGGEHVVLGRRAPR